MIKEDVYLGLSEEGTLTTPTLTPTNSACTCVQETWKSARKSEPVF